MKLPCRERMLRGTTSMLKEEGEHAKSDKEIAEISNEKCLVRHTNFRQVIQNETDCIGIARYVIKRDYQE
jgi:hypothetical protein